MSAQLGNPAERMAGVTLSDGWLVGSMLATGRRGGGSGGFFSVSYSVEKEGRQAFLKAFDIFKPITDAVNRGGSMTQELLAQLSAYEAEASLHALCADRNMKRIVKILSHGQVNLTPLPGEQISTVPYMIMELADRGDVRRYIQQAQNIDLSMKLTYLRDVASGIIQLHTVRIAHQDLKPSNVMIFSDLGAKIGDLGRASIQNKASPHDEYFVAGDRTYAPPEQIYRHQLDDWFDKRQRCDLYQFGSLISFVFFGVPLNSVFKQRLPSELIPVEWFGPCTSYEQALPFLLQVFNETLLEWSTELPSWLSSSLIEIIRQCGTPSYSLRGSKRTMGMSSPNLGLDRFVSELNELAFKATLQARKTPMPTMSK